MPAQAFFKTLLGKVTEVPPDHPKLAVANFDTLPTIRALERAEIIHGAVSESFEKTYTGASLPLVTQQAWMRSTGDHAWQVSMFAFDQRNTAEPLHVSRMNVSDLSEGVELLVKHANYIVPTEDKLQQLDRKTGVEYEVSRDLRLAIAALRLEGLPLRVKLEEPPVAGL